MEKQHKREEKIKESFEAFFTDFERETWRSSDFKKYQQSIYNVLCANYKNDDNKINREYILEHFVPKEKKNGFKHTNVYDKIWITNAFKEFFAIQKEKWKLTWSTSDLEEWNQSLVITLSNQYWHQNRQKVDREKFEKDYELENLGCTFIRKAPIRTPISIENINKDLQELLGKKYTGTRSPDSLFTYKPQYLKRLGKKYRDERGKIDRIFIIHKVLNDKDIIDTFRHRYAYDRLLKVPSETTRRNRIKKEIKDRDSLNPEELLIFNEEETTKKILLQRIYESMERILTKWEKQLVYNFLEGDITKKRETENIIKRLKTDIENQEIETH